jgi:hypothetical protein
MLLKRVRDDEPRDVRVMAFPDYAYQKGDRTGVEFKVESRLV